MNRKARNAPAENRRNMTLLTFSLGDSLLGRHNARHAYEATPRRICMMAMRPKEESIHTAYATVKDMASSLNVVTCREDPQHYFGLVLAD